MKRSAGILLYRFAADGEIEVLLVHPGGPFWARKDNGAWSIPKGEYGADEDPRSAAAREFTEETGSPLPAGALVDLGSITQASGKLVTAYGMQADLDASSVRSNHFELEWPPRSGRLRSFPEIDRAGWFDAATARRKLVRGQVEFVERLLAVAQGSSPTA